MEISDSKNSNSERQGIIYNRIKDLLLLEGVSFKELHHAPTRTSEESAKARGESLKIGGKCLILKVDKDFKAFVLSAEKRIDSVKIKKQFKAKKIRFATPDELMNTVGLVPGSIPPFGPPIMPFPLYIDKSIIKNEKIAFNAGSLTDSIIMSTEDYLKVADAKIFEFSKN